MALRITNLRLPIDELEASLPGHVARTLGVPLGDLGGWRILRKALDSRDKRRMQFVYNFEVEAPPGFKVPYSASATIEEYAAPSLPRSPDFWMAERQISVPVFLSSAIIPASGPPGVQISRSPSTRGDSL